MIEAHEVALKDIVNLVSEKFFPSKEDSNVRCINLEDIQEGSGRITSWTSASENLSAKTIFKKGDVLFGKLRPYLRKFAQAPFDGVCTTEIMVFRAKDGIAPDYVYQIISSEDFVEHNVAASYGTKMPRTDWTTAAKFSFSLPQFNEQLGIAEVLSALDEQIEQIDALIAKSVLARLGLYASLLEVAPPSVQVKEHFELSSGLTPLRSKTHFYSQSGTPWVKTLDLNEARLKKTDESITQSAFDACSLRVLPLGTVLVAMYGGWEQIGRTALLDTAACTNQAITALTPKISEEWNPYFVLKAFQALRHKWRGFAVSTRKDPNITKADIGNFRLPKPSIDEQNYWAENLEIADEVISDYKAEAKKLRLQKQGLMRDLLTGKTRVQ